jgi:hypothetical protein
MRVSSASTARSEPSRTRPGSRRRRPAPSAHRGPPRLEHRCTGRVPRADARGRAELLGGKLRGGEPGDLALGEFAVAADDRRDRCLAGARVALDERETILELLEDATLLLVEALAVGPFLVRDRSLERRAIEALITLLHKIRGTGEDVFLEHLLSPGG